MRLTLIYDDEQYEITPTDVDVSQRTLSKTATVWYDYDSVPKAIEDVSPIDIEGCDAVVTDEDGETHSGKVFKAESGRFVLDV